jgi:cytosine/adenosine deaminase-related metal-dependent hydrolase
LYPWLAGKPRAALLGALGDLVVRENGRVRHVIVGGRIVIENGRLAVGDMDVISGSAQKLAARLWDRMAAM